MSTPNVSNPMAPVNGRSHKVVEISWDDFASGTFPENPTRQAWRAAVMDVAERVKAKLPEAGSRIAAAIKIVLQGDVELQPDGTARVMSQSRV